MNKHEWRKKENGIYIPKTKPELVDIPKFKYISISGEGNPNSEVFSKCIKTLYSISYPIKMTLKKLQNKPIGYMDYVVYPLEGVWGLNEKAIEKFTGKINKDDLIFKIMIRQPDFVTKHYFEKILKVIKDKDENILLEKLKFESIIEGKCIQILHIGSFDNEIENFKKMEKFAEKNNMGRSSMFHREIYLSDFRRVSTEKLKTVLRFKVKKLT